MDCSNIGLINWFFVISFLQTGPDAGAAAGLGADTPLHLPQEAPLILRQAQAG